MVTSAATTNRIRNSAAKRILRNLPIWTAEGGPLTGSVLCEGLWNRFKTVESTREGLKFTGLRFPGALNGEECVEIRTRPGHRHWYHKSIVLGVYSSPRRPLRLDLFHCERGDDGQGVFVTGDGEAIARDRVTILGAIHRIEWGSKTFEDEFPLQFGPNWEHTSASRSASYWYWLSFQRFWGIA